MTRIIAGVAGGRRLRTPTGGATRPTTDRVREALFSALASELGSIEGCRFLDLYAGSGAVGLEASSRGAATVTLVEKDARTATLIRENARTLGFDGVTVIAAAVERLTNGPLRVQRTSTARRGTETPGQPFDVAFLDPPYALAAPGIATALVDLVAARWLSTDTLVVVERARRGAEWRWPDAVEALRGRRYGETMLWYGRVSSTYR